MMILPAKLSQMVGGWYTGLSPLPHSWACRDDGIKTAAEWVAKHEIGRLIALGADLTCLVDFLSVLVLLGRYSRAWDVCF